MGRRRKEEYRFRGRPIVGSGRSFSEASDQLWQFWTSRPSLLMHMYGVLMVSMRIGSLAVVFEVVDLEVLDRVAAGDSDAFVAFIARAAGISAEQMQVLVSNSDEFILQVDRIRSVSNPNMWTVDPGMDPSSVLPPAVPVWGEDLIQQDKISSADRRSMLEMVVVARTDEGETLAQLSERISISRSTLRDALKRAQKDSESSKPQPSKPKEKEIKQKLSDREREQIVLSFLSTENAAETARRLQTSPRTVRRVVKEEGLREISKKTESKPARVQAPKVRTAHPRPVRTVAERQRFFKAVASGKSVREAAQAVGVSVRTAQRWAKKGE